MRSSKVAVAGGSRFQAGRRPAPSWQVDYFAPVELRPLRPSTSRRLLTFTVLPSWVPPRRYALRWQVVQWAAVLVLTACVLAL